MAVEEKVFYVEKKEIFDNEVLKMQGFKYESGSTLGKDKPGYYLIIKAEEEWFKKDEVKEALKDAEEISKEEKEEVIKKIEELEESAAAGISLFD